MRRRIGPAHVVCLILAPLAILRAALVLGHRVPAHDAFELLQLQYTFFNKAALHGALPQWLPFSAQGGPSNYWIVLAQGLLPSVFTAAAPLLKWLNFLYLFEAGVFFDECVLVLGCVLLAGRCYRSTAAVVFVAVSIGYTAIWSTQPVFDFHLYYLLPLILYCLDRGLTEGSAGQLSLAALFGTATLFGNVAYSAPLTAMVLLVFTLSAYLPVPGGVRAILTRRHATAVAVPLLALGALAVYLRNGMTNAVIRSVGRGTDGRLAGPAVFLRYGGAPGFGKFFEFVARVPHHTDITVYAGLLVVPFILVSVVAARSRLARGFGLTALVLGLFSAGTPLAVVFYDAFPFGRFVRHIGLVAPTVKLFLVFYAGFGFDAFWPRFTNGADAPASPAAGRRERLILALPPAAMRTLAVLLAGFLLLVVTYRIGFLLPPVSTMVIDRIESLTFDPAEFVPLVLAVVFSGVFWAGRRWPRQGWVAGTILLALHGADVFWMKAALEYERSIPLSGAAAALFRVHRYGYPVRRTQRYAANARFAVLAPCVINIYRTPIAAVGRRAGSGRGGELYGTGMDSFLFLDSAASPFRTDFWQRGVDEFYRVWVPPSRDERERLGFPLPGAPAYRRLTGLARPKIQFFSRIHALRDDRDVAAALGRPTFGGDAVFTTAGDAARTAGEDDPVVDVHGRIDPAASDRLHDASAEVVDFTFDRLRLRVSGPAAAASVLYYAEPWNPGWHAVVNQKPVPVMRANLGYQAIVVPPGHSEVTLAFGDSRTRLLADVAAGVPLAAVGAVVLLAFTGLRPPGD